MFATRCALFVLAALIGAALIGGAGPAGQARALGQAGYASLLGQARALVARGKAGQAAALLRGATVVVTAAGPVAPDNRAILADLAARPPQLGTALIRLDALLARLNARQGAGGGPHDDPQALARIVGQPPFVGAPASSPWDALSQMVGNWLGRLLRAAGLGGVPEPLTRALTALLVLVAAVIVAVVVVGSSRGLLGSLTPSPSTIAAAQPGEALRDPAVAVARARAAAAGGDYREGVRYLFLAMLLELDARDVLRFDPSAATRDLVRQARRSERGVGDLLDGAARLFERTWYGHVATHETDYAAMEALATRIAAAQERPAQREVVG